MNQTPATPDPRVRWTAHIPLGLALILICAVWVLGCVWSFREQTSYAQFKQFHMPQLLPLVIDGLAVAMAAVAYAASLDGRSATFPRLGTFAAVCLSAGSNTAWAFERSRADAGTMALAAVVPVIANLAFEVLLSEARRRVMRRRGIPIPVALPYPRGVRVILSPFKTFVQWRRLVLDATDLAPLFAAAKVAANVAPDPITIEPLAIEQTPAARRRTPRPRTPAAIGQTPTAAEDQTPNRTPEQTPETGVRQITAVVNRDATDLAKLHANFNGRTPSINEVQKLVGGGRARAIRLRGLLANADATDPDDDPDRPAINGHPTPHLIGVTQ